MYALSADVATVGKQRHNDDPLPRAQGAITEHLNYFADNLDLIIYLTQVVRTPPHPVTMYSLHLRSTSVSERTRADNINGIKLFSTLHPPQHSSPLASRPLLVVASLTGSCRLRLWVTHGKRSVTGGHLFDAHVLVAEVSKCDSNAARVRCRNIEAQRELEAQA